MDKTPLDDLLNQVFLESDFSKVENESLLNSVSESVLGGSNIASLNNSLFHQIKILLRNKGFISIALISIVTISWFGLNFLKKTNEITYSPRESNYLTLGYSVDEEEKEIVKTLEPLDTKSFRILKRPMYSYNKPLSAELLIPDINYEIPFLKIDSVVDEEVYRFPILTPEEIAANQKRKEIMLKSILKLDKDKFAEIDVSKQVKNQHGFVMQNFYMRTSEVSNIEYKTFLFDILLQRRKEDFLIAKPKQDEWLSLGNSFTEGMKDLYFSHPAYDDYPVVNVSRIGAEMYCEWLWDLVSKSYKNRNRVEQVRLPYDFEWDYAASGGNEKNQYSWGGAYVKNSEGCFLANYHPIKNEPNADGGLYTVTAESYNPNEFGLYNMSGNVAEMVSYFNDDTLIGTKGGSFKDQARFIQIKAPDLNKGETKPKPYIGFRPIVLCRSGINRLVGTLGDNSNLNIAHREEVYNKNKSRIMEFWDRHQNFSLVSGGDFKINKSHRYVEPFFIQKTEVSNASYKEFIKILKEQNKTDLSKKYSPDGSKWNSAPYEEYYFTHASYEDYPVVNITREAAVAYCKWLEDIINEQEKNISERDQINPIRVSVSLPSNIEWIAAASNMGKYNDYPWHSTLRNNGKKYEGQYMANFMHTKKEVEDNVSGGTLNDNAALTAPVYSYWPNTLGIYNMGGNVAEMVTYEDGSIGAKGGSWNQPAKAMLIHAGDLFKEISTSNKEIGFRPIIKILK